MAYIDFITKVHTSTKRDYLERVVKYDKAECAAVAKKFGQEYWDGDRRHGYGGFRYDARWYPVAQKMAEHYQLKPGDKILDIGCGKGFLLYEFTRVVPGIQVTGLDVSQYALDHAKEEVKPFLKTGNAVHLPFEDHSFDFIVSLNTLHNLYNYELDQALKEIERVGKTRKYIQVESYRNEREKANLLNWQLTCEMFYTPAEWEWAFKQSGYAGDHGFIYFE